MQLHRPAALGVQPRAAQQNDRRDHPGLLRRDRAAANQRGESTAGPLERSVFIEVKQRETVVGQTSAEPVERLVPGGQRVEKVVQGTDRPVGRAAQLFQIRLVGACPIFGHRA